METKYFQNKYGLIDCEDAGLEVGRKKDEFFTHTGIIAGASKFGNKKAIIQSHNYTGVSLVWIDEFASNQIVYYTDNLPDNRFDSLKRGFSLLEMGYDYHLLDNCQHCSYYCITGKAKSKAVDNTTDFLFWAGLLGTAIGIATENKTLTKIGATSAGIGVVGKIIEYQLQQKKSFEREVKFIAAMNLAKEKTFSLSRLNLQRSK